MSLSHIHGLVNLTWPALRGVACTIMGSKFVPLAFLHTHIHEVIGSNETAEVILHRFSMRSMCYSNFDLPFYVCLTLFPGA